VTDPGSGFASNLNVKLIFAMLLTGSAYRAGKKKQPKECVLLFYVYYWILIVRFVAVDRSNIIG
jgi:hypothetical protein